MARRSTWVDLHGTQIRTRGLGCRKLLSCTLLMKYCSIFSQTLKSAITPSFIGRMAEMLPGVRPSMRLASVPTATTLFWLLALVRIATTDGSFSTMPRSRT